MFDELNPDHAEAYLKATDGSSLYSRTARIRKLISSGPPKAPFILFPGHDEGLWVARLVEEAVFTYVSGYFIASIFLSQAALEHALAAYFGSESAPERKRTSVAE